VIRAEARLPRDLRDRWVWWRLPAPRTRNTRLKDLLESDEAVTWLGPARTRALLAQIGPAHRDRLSAGRDAEGGCVAAAFRRIRIERGVKTQRVELRLDGLAGCLRTPGGGSSRQWLIVAEGEHIRSRLITAREGARLMGLFDDYRLPRTATGAFKVIGDGVAVPVVRYLAHTLLEPLCAMRATMAAAE
jgi:DNA (cytosine-5)-methyltransferase 1